MAPKAYSMPRAYVLRTMCNESCKKSTHVRYFRHILVANFIIIITEFHEAIGSQHTVLPLAERYGKVLRIVTPSVLAWNACFSIGFPSLQKPSESTAEPRCRRAACRGCGLSYNKMVILRFSVIFLHFPYVFHTFYYNTFWVILRSLLMAPLWKYCVW